jgi:hypothetical protein
MKEEKKSEKIHLFEQGRPVFEALLNHPNNYFNFSVSVYVK